MKCVYCDKELLFPWELRRVDCDDCHYAITVTYYDNHSELEQADLTKRGNQEKSSR